MQTRIQQPGRRRGQRLLPFRLIAGTLILGGIFGFANLPSLATPRVPSNRQTNTDPTGNFQIQQRIRLYRMADLTVSVRDARGQPVPGVRVTVTQTRHAFLFGCNTLPLRPDNHDAWQQAYQARFAALFNFAAVGFFWNGFEAAPGQPRYAFVDSQVAWLLAHGITCEGTPLVWHESYPDWVPTDPTATIPLLNRRVTDLITHYHADIHCWIVANETLSASGFPVGEANWVKRDGPASVVAATLNWASEAGRGVPETFIYNDYNTGSDEVALLTRLAALGALPDAVGVQAHMHQGTLSMAQLWQTCQSLSRFGKPLYFTESTVLSGPARSQSQIDYTGPPASDWQTTPAGEAAQADYVVRFYSLLFSHPAVRAINWWDLSDRDAWLGAPAGLLHADMTPKPAYDQLLTLLHTTWWTQGSGRSDRSGRYRIHAFYGDYTITVTDRHGRILAQSLAWPESSGPRVVTVTIPGS